MFVDYFYRHANRPAAILMGNHGSHCVYVFMTQRVYVRSGSVHLPCRWPLRSFNELKNFIVAVVVVAAAVLTPLLGRRSAICCRWQPTVTKFAMEMLSFPQTSYIIYIDHLLAIQIH